MEDGERDVRYFDAFGKISKDVYIKVTDKPDKNGRYTIQNVKTQELLPIDPSRIVPASAFGKALCINGSQKYRIVCPVDRCQSEMYSEDKKTAVCKQHGTFELFHCGAHTMPNAQSEAKLEPKEKNETINIDETYLAQYGEVWAKSADFDHANIAVLSITILAIDPPRKMCFNTYDGTLGKKSSDPVAELGLEDFKAGGLGKKGKALKHPIETERDLLRKKGCKKFQC